MSIKPEFPNAGRSIGIALIAIGAVVAFAALGLMGPSVSTVTSIVSPVTNKVKSLFGGASTTASAS